MAKGAVTASYQGDKQQVISLLNDIIATEIVCYLRYSQHAIAAAGMSRSAVATEFTEHAGDEMQHALMAAERVAQLGGSPDFNPASLTARSHTEYVVPDETDLKAMLEENLVAERIAVATYQEIARWIGDGDPTTRRLIETILAQEEEHADDLLGLLGSDV
jgi:bacterioferritin